MGKHSDLLFPSTFRDLWCAVASKAGARDSDAMVAVAYASFILSGNWRAAIDVPHSIRCAGAATSVPGVQPDAPFFKQA
jgi:hypothetical protein